MYLALVSRFSRLQRGCVCVCVAAFYLACKLLQFTAVIIMPFWSSWNPYIYLHFFSGEILSSEAPNTPSGSCDRYDTVDLRFGSFSSIPLLFSFFLSLAWSKCHFSNHSTVYFPFILAMINQHHYTINSTWIVNHSTLRYTFFYLFRFFTEKAYVQSTSTTCMPIMLHYKCNRKEKKRARFSFSTNLLLEPFFFFLKYTRKLFTGLQASTCS